MMEASIQEAICFFCLALLPEVEVGFCPSCGSVLFQNSVVSTKTTASYDPMSREYKPWREKPLLKKRNYKFFEGKLKPWFPASQPRPPKLLKPVRVALSDQIIEEPSVQNGDINKLDHASNNEAAIADAGGISYIEKAIADSEVCSLREVTYPLAAYELFEAPDGSNVLMLVSLIEQFYGKYPMPRLYWLKIVSAFTTSSEDSAETPEDSPSAVLPTNTALEVELKSKCFPSLFLSNAAAAITFPNVDGWVDLEKIDGDQFCVTQHLQKTLEYFKERIVHKHQLRHCPALILDGDAYNQLMQYSDEMRNDADCGVVCWKAYSAELLVEEKHLTWTALSYNNNPENTKTLKMVFKSDWYSMKLDDFEEYTVLDECLMVSEGNVRISRTTPTRYLPVRIHSYLEYRAQLDSSNISRISAKLSKKEFCGTALPTHIRLVMYPVQTQTALELHWTAIPILSLTLSTESVDMLFSDTNVLEKTTISTENVKQAWAEVIHRILTYLRLEYSAEQLFYSMVGSFSQPVRESAAWPEEAISKAFAETEDVDY